MAFRFPKITTPTYQKGFFEDPLGETKKFVGDTAGSVSDAITNAISDLGTGIAETVGGGPSGGGLGAAMAAGTAAMNAERTNAYNTAISTPGLNVQTRKEIESLYNSGAPASEIAKYLADAKEGKGGIFFIRKSNDERKRQAALAPGRTVLSLGGGSVLGGGRGY